MPIPTGTAVCAICQSPVETGEGVTECPGCHARYHTDCWQENQGCAVYGCSEVPPTETLQSLEIPVSYWGQEEKPCPVCGQVILAAAVRCRHCGATFQSARPETADEFHSRAHLQNRSAGLRTSTIWLFIFCLLPCTAPLAGIVGGLWYVTHRQEYKGLPRIYESLCLLGLALAAVEIIMIVGFSFSDSSLRVVRRAAPTRMNIP